MSNRPRGGADGRQPLTRRQQAWQQREANLQRRVVLAIGGAVLLAFLVIAGGVVYEQFVVPGRTIKAVNGQTLTRGDYDRVARLGTIQQMAQSLQFARLLGANASFGQEQGGSFTEQVVQANQQLAELGTIRGRREPVLDQTVDQWVDNQLVEQAAQAQFNINPSQGEVDQLVVERLGSLLATPEPVTATAELTATDGVATADALATTGPAETVEPAATADVTATAAETATGPTQTPAPTASPTASPVPDVAITKAEEIFGILYDEYTGILNDLPEAASSDIRSPHITQAELSEAIRAQYRAELIQTRVKEELVPTVTADETTEPEQISARHILLKVPKPEPSPTATAAPDGTATADTGATAEGTAEAGATVESTALPEVTAPPEPTPTLEPGALEVLFAERKKEVDEIYQRVLADPESFADIAREVSEDEGSAPQGGDLGTFGRGQMVGPFEETAFALKENEISPPIRTEFGWHIIQRLPEDPEAKLERQRQAAYDAWVSELRSNATIVPAPTPTATELPLPTPFETETAPELDSTGVLPEETAPAETEALPAVTAPVEEATTAAP